MSKKNNILLTCKSRRGVMGFYPAEGDTMAFDLKHHSITFFRNNKVMIEIENRFDSIHFESRICLSFCDHVSPDHSQYIRGYVHADTVESVDVSSENIDMIAALVANMNDFDIEKVYSQKEDEIFVYHLIARNHSSKNCLEIVEKIK